MSCFVGKLFELYVPEMIWNILFMAATYGYVVRNMYLCISCETYISRDMLQRKVISYNVSARNGLADSW